jgi:1-acyl-sn-glycerol-3-phosphate acyltransferase
MPELVYPPVILTAKLGFKALGLRFLERGEDNIPRSGGAVLASNHVSYLDFIFVGLAARPAGRLVRFMAKEAVFRHRVAGPIMRGMRHIPVDREAGAAAYADAVAALRRGEIVGVFPEATISRSFQLKQFRSGAARMAAEADVPIIPMVTWGGQRILTKGRPRDLTRGRTIAMTVGEPFAVTDDPRATTDELRRRMQALLEQTQEHYTDRPLGADDRWWLPVHLGGTAPSYDAAEAMDAEEGAARAAARSATGLR